MVIKLASFARIAGLAVGAFIQTVQTDTGIDTCGCELRVMGIVHTIGAAVVAASGLVFAIGTLQALELVGPSFVACGTLQVTRSVTRVVVP